MEAPALTEPTAVVTQPVWEAPVAAEERQPEPDAPAPEQVMAPAEAPPSAEDLSLVTVVDKPAPVELVTQTEPPSLEAPAAPAAEELVPVVDTPVEAPVAAEPSPIVAEELDAPAAAKSPPIQAAVPPKKKKKTQAERLAELSTPRIRDDRIKPGCHAYKPPVRGLAYRGTEKMAMFQDRHDGGMTYKHREENEQGEIKLRLRETRGNEKVVLKDNDADGVARQRSIEEATGIRKAGGKGFSAASRCSSASGSSTSTRVAGSRPEISSSRASSKSSVSSKAPKGR